jgi:hypothetical protein
MTDDADPNPGHADPNPGPADPNPGQLVVAAVDRCLELARTWHAWDGRPIARTMDDGLPNTWTPHKALRRIADHLVDHLHQVEALLAGATPLPDEWLGRTVTVDADWSRFTEPDYAEACSRLRRLGRWYVLRYETAGADAWDRPQPDAWTLREIAEHVAGVTYYAEQVGSLAGR